MNSILARVSLITAAMVLAGPSLALAETQATPVAQTSSPPPADFGAPPSGQIPILYNDRHVYVSPDILKQGRVLGALVRGGTIYIPLRSMFEQMGATVSYDAASKTATVSKAGASVVVTVGKPEVVINGESRPLDVPPIVYHGVVLVPVRVISEGMGAYVQWVPDRHIVVVRYIQATPPPTEAPPPPAPPPTVAPPPPPPPTPNPLTLGGQFRSYYFTRQNASNNPGTQFDFTPGAKYNSNGVNQASWNSSIALHGEYDFPGGWDVGGTYFYANPIDGPCVVPANHLKTAPYPSPNCVQQVPPNTNPDDTLPGFTLSTFTQAYLGYNAHGFNGELGNLVFNSPWAPPSDTRLKPSAFEGAYLNYTTGSYWTFEGADMLTFENRTSSSFSQNTLLTSYPAGSPGLASNIYLPNGYGINTNGFTMGKVGYDNPTGLSVNGYFYGVSDIVNMWWGDAKYQFNQSSWAPYIALQGGTESNAGQSYIGKIDSQLFGAQLGFNITKNLVFQGSYDSIPWHNDTVFLPKNVTCSNSNYQISAKGATLAYFLPTDAAQCFTNPNGTTNIYYGGWASPYTDSYDSDPIFTTSTSQGMADRRAPGTSWKAGVTFTSTNLRWVFIATDAWYNYGNALAPENTNIWVLDGQYHFSKVSATGPYHGLLLRYRYIQRSLTNTFCGDDGTSCPPSSSAGTPYLGGLPLFKYNRAQLEYDF
jgi:Copper amine oxidase N-terminal domain